MEINKGDYVRYKGKVYSVAHTHNINRSGNFNLISYKDLEILTNIHKSELEKLTDFHVSVMRFNKSLPPRRFKVGDRVKLRADLDSECSCSYTFSFMEFEENKAYTIDYLNSPCVLKANGWSVHEFEVELVEGN